MRGSGVGFAHSIFSHQPIVSADTRRGYSWLGHRNARQRAPSHGPARTLLFTNNTSHQAVVALEPLPQPRANTSMKPQSTDTPDRNKIFHISREWNSQLVGNGWNVNLQIRRRVTSWHKASFKKHRLPVHDGFKLKAQPANFESEYCRNHLFIIVMCCVIFFFGSVWWMNTKVMTRDYAQASNNNPVGKDGMSVLFQ